MSPATVFVDADNTLWDTDAVFAAAQLALLAFAEEEISRGFAGSDRLAFIRDIDQRLAARHHAGLRYPPRLLAQGVALALSGVSPGQAAGLAIKGTRERQSLSGMAAAVAEEAFSSAVRELPDPRPGVREGLAALHAAGSPVLVVTEGARARVAKTAAAHGIDRFIGRIIEAPKWPDLYRRVLRLAGTPPRAFMVGDQLDRDIVPASAAGLETIWFPGGFRPSWEPAFEDVRPSHTIESFAEVPPIVIGGARRAS